MRKKINVGILVFVNVAVFVFLFSFVMRQQKTVEVNTNFGYINIIFIFIGGLQALFTYRHVKRNREKEEKEPSTLERLRAISKEFDENSIYDVYNLDEDEEFDELKFREDENKRMMKNYRYCKHCGEGLPEDGDFCPRCGEKTE